MLQKLFVAHCVSVQQGSSSATNSNKKATTLQNPVKKIDKRLNPWIHPVPNRQCRLRFFTTKRAFRTVILSKAVDFIYMISQQTFSFQYIKQYRVK